MNLKINHLKGKPAKIMLYSNLSSEFQIEHPEAILINAILDMVIFYKFILYGRQHSIMLDENRFIQITISE